MATSSRASSSLSVARSERSLSRVITTSILAVAGVALALGLVACKKVLNGGSEDSFHIRMVNLVEDSPTVQYSIDDTVIASSTYLTGTARNAGHPGDHKVTLSVLPPVSLNSADSTAAIPLGGSFTQSWAKNRDYFVYAYGTVAAPQTFVLDEDSGAVTSTPDDDFITYQFVNAAPDAAAVDVYLTAPEGAITTPTKVATLNFGAKSEITKLKLTRAADSTATGDLPVNFTIELRDPTTGAVEFTSTKQLQAEKQQMLWAIVKNTGPGNSQFRVVTVLPASALLGNVDDQAALRVVHVSPDSGNFDVYRGSSLTTPIAQNLAFRSASPFISVNPGTVNLIGLPAGSTSVAILFVEEFTALANGTYSAYTVGPQGSLEVVTTQDDPRSVPTQSEFRFYNVAPSLSAKDPLDVYVTLPGQALDFTAATTVTTDDAAQFKRATITYKTAPSAYVTLKSGTYQVRMTPTNTSTIVFDQQVTVVDGSVTTFALVDDIATATLQLLPVVDAAPAP